jgi:hypothetical protein
MRINLFQGLPQAQRTKINRQRYDSIILKLKKNVRTPSLKIGSLLLIFSLVLIGSPLLLEQKIDWSDIFQNLGYNLIGSVCSFIAFDIILLQLKRSDNQQGVKLDYFDKLEFINRVRESKPLKNFSFEHKVTVKIIETWTELLRDPNYKEMFAQAIYTCLENNPNYEVEILLLNPDNKDLVEARSADLQSISDEFNSMHITENVYVNFLEIQKIFKKLEVNGNQDRLKVRCYNNVPFLAMYMCSPYLFVTFFRPGKLATMSEQLKLHIDSPVSPFITQRFDDIWQDAKTIPLENCLYVTLDVIQSGRYQATYDKVKYIYCDQLYYLQNPKLFRDIANRKDINIRIDGKLFKPKDVSLDDLPSHIKQFFQSKYMTLGELFIALELLN